MSDSTVSQSRRTFLKRSVTATGFTLGLALLPATRPQAMFANAPESDSFAPNVFISFAEDGKVEITCHRSEMGQQVRTSIPQIMMEELGADWQHVTIKQATGDAKYGDQNTDGSRSVRRNFKRLREAGATAALMLCTAAAKGWQVDPYECETQSHFIVHKPSGRKVAFADVVAVAAKLPVPKPSDLKLKSRDKWTQIGKAVPSVDLTGMTTGTAVYGQDVVMDNMLYAVIQRPPVLFSSVKSSNQAEVKKMAGVVDVIDMPAASAPALFNPLGGIAVLATNTWLAWQACNALKTEWQTSEHASYNSDDYQQALLDNAAKPGEVIRKLGNFEQATADAARVVDASYYAPHLAQAPMEPPAATAVVTDDSAEIWACVQSPQTARQQVAGALKLPLENVTINVTLLGGGFGRKAKPDFAVEAALLARQAGRPVKVVWRREDDIKHGYFHSVSGQRLSATLDENNHVTGWYHKTVFPPISSTFNPAANKPSDGELDLGHRDTPFVNWGILNRPLPMPQEWWMPVIMRRILRKRPWNRQPLPLWLPTIALKSGRVYNHHKRRVSKLPAPLNYRLKTSPSTLLYSAVALAVRQNRTLLLRLRCWPDKLAGRLRLYGAVKTILNTVTSIRSVVSA